MPKLFTNHMLKIKYILPLVFIILILNVTFFITSLSYKLYQSHFINNLSLEHITTLSQVNSNIDKIKGEIITISDMFYNDPTFNQIINSTITEQSIYHLEMLDYIRTLDKQVHATLTHYSFPYEVQLIGNNGIIYSSNATQISTLKKYPDQLWYYTAKSSVSNLYWLPSIRIDSERAYDTNYFSLVRFIKSKDQKDLGVLMINVPEDTLYKTYKELLLKSYSNIYIVDKNGQIVSHKEKTMIGHHYYKMSKFKELFNNSESATIFKNNTPYLFSKYENPDLSWIIVEEIPMWSIQEPFLAITKHIISISLLICIISILITIIISHYICGQISSICTTINKAHQGDLNITFPQKGFYEIRVISTACENFLTQNVNLLNTLKKKEHLKQLTELHFYQMQINPHFMHNTLFTIKCMVDMDRREGACKMLDALNTMLKNILNTDQKLVSVKEELETLENYTYILQQRYANSFSIIYLVDPLCKDMLILRFILQPIVENSVFHGFSNIKKDGKIIIKITANDEIITLSVSDNGIGMSSDTIKQILNSTTSKSKHLGINNIRSRLNIHYEEKASFNIYSEIGKGCETIITVPQYKV